MKLFFIPISVLGGLVAGLAGRKLFERLWGVIDDEEPPDPRHREISMLKMVAALALEGAIFRTAKGLADHSSRRSFARMTGAWPGEERPEPE
jgi:uncharacterized protein DUF4235